MSQIYTLPELAYDFGALEPHISGKIMELHHGKHHAAYVQGANTTLEKLAEARSTGDDTGVPALERALAFHLSGHVLHSIFWKNLAPGGADRPAGDLLAAIDAAFGGFDMFQRQMTAAAGSVMGSGWAALVWEPMARRLLITQIYDHQSNAALGAPPLLVIDAWEHAFYLQYRNRKADYLDALWHVWNWDDVAARFQATRGLDLVVPGSVR